MLTYCVVEQFDRAKSVQSTNNVDTDIKYGNLVSVRSLIHSSPNFEVFSAESLRARSLISSFRRVLPRY